MKIPSLKSTFIPLLVSGLTASIALEQLGNLNFDHALLDDNSINNNININNNVDNKKKKTVLGLVFYLLLIKMIIF